MLEGSVNSCPTRPLDEGTRRFPFRGFALRVAREFFTPSSYLFFFISFLFPVMVYEP